jgi:hypothetical protein
MYKSSRAVCIHLRISERHTLKCFILSTAHLSIGMGRNKIWIFSVEKVTKRVFLDKFPSPSARNLGVIFEWPDLP